MSDTENKKDKVLREWLEAIANHDKLVAKYFSTQVIPGESITTIRWPPSLGQDRGNIKSGSRYPQGIQC